MKLLIALIAAAAAAVAVGTASADVSQTPVTTGSLVRRRNDRRYPP